MDPITKMDTMLADQARHRLDIARSALVAAKKRAEEARADIQYWTIEFGAARRALGHTERDD